MSKKANRVAAVLGAALVCFVVAPAAAAERPPGDMAAPPVSDGRVVGDQSSGPVPGVVFTKDAAPAQFLPFAELRKLRKALGTDRPSAAAATCHNLYIQNTHGLTWSSYFTVFSQLYWCHNYAVVTYVYRNRGIEGSRNWEFIQWTGFAAGGCVNCQYVSMSSSSQWKLTRVGWYDSWCYPNEYLVGMAGGSYHYERSSC